MANGVTTTKGTVGASSQNKNDGVTGLLLSGPAVAGKIVLGQTVKLTGLRDADALGINAAYDTANEVRVFRHIAEFYRMAGEGIDLYLMLYPQASLPADVLSDTYAKKLIADAKGAIRLFGLGYNPPAGYAPVAVDGMEAGIRASISALQDFADWTDSTFRAVHTVLECRGLSVAAPGALDIRNISINNLAVQYPQVSLCIAQDYDYAHTLNAIGQKFADIGTLLGALAGRKVNENPGEVGAVNLTDTRKGKWLTAGISSHTKTGDIEADLGEWDTKGYILAWDYQSEAVSGFRWSDDPVCAPVIEDENGNLNESSIALSRTNIKVRRMIRDKYLPKVKSVQALDTATGKLAIGQVKYLEGLGNDIFKSLANDGFISGGKTVVDPNSDLLTGAKSLNVAYSWVPLGTIGAINGVVNIKASLS